MVISLDSDRRLAQRIRSVYADSPLLARIEQSLRPSICPFDLVVNAVPRGARVLDVGCGSGLLLALLALAGRRIIGVGFDTDRNAIGCARMMVQHLADTGSMLSFERRDATAPWPRESFDVVCMVDLLHHVPVRAQEAVFAQAVDAIQPGGLVVYKDMCRRPRWRAAANQLHDLALARQWIHHVPVERVERWASNRGLTLEAHAFATRLWYGHDLRVFRRPTS